MIFSDSSSALHTVSNKYTDHPIALSINHRLNELATQHGKNVELCWVPSHCGIEGNERADTAAVQASRRDPEFIPIF